MNFLWKDYEIDLKKLNSKLKALTPKVDGISAYEEGFTVVTFEELTPEEIMLIQECCSEAEELVRIDLELLMARISEIKSSMLLKSWEDLSVVERKLLLNVELSQEEIEGILNG